MPGEPGRGAGAMLAAGGLARDGSRHGFSDGRGVAGGLLSYLRFFRFGTEEYAAARKLVR